MAIDSTIVTTLRERAANKCELCSAQEYLAVYEVQPHSGLSSETAVFLCGVCRDALANPGSVEAAHWYGLNESIWSEHAPVKVLAYRVLKGLPGNAWAQDLLSQMYLDDETLVWADAGIVQSDGDADGGPVLDSNGTPLQEGDTVTLIKDLDVKGANFTAKRGTTVKNIMLTDDPRYIEGKVNGMRIVLVAAYLKKA